VPFSNYDWKSARPWNCFSLVADHRSVDIECLTREQFNTWYFGLLHLVPLNFNNMDRAQVLWRIGLFKTVQISLQCKMPVNDVWHRLVKQAREDMTNSPEKPKSELTTPRSQKFNQAIDTAAKAN
jgi:hypothetical protein